jgi:hypothetical protein
LIFQKIFLGKIVKLTPKGQRSLFSKKCSNRPFLAQ